MRTSGKFLLRAGVIGIGSMGRHHLRIYNEREDVEVVGIADINPRALSAHQKRYRLKTFTDYRQLLKEGLDIVSVAVPTKFHSHITLDALEADCHVLVEKPISPTLEEGRKMIRTANHCGKILLVGHTERFNPLVKRLKEVVLTRKIGDPISISTARVSPYPARIQDVGIILDFAIHDIDVISYLYGEKAISVYAIAGSTNEDQEDHASVMLKFNQNRAGIIEISWRSPIKLRKILMTGTEGFALGDFIDQSIFYLEEGWSRERSLEKLEPLALEIDHFIRCVRGETLPEITGEESLYSLRTALLAEKSARTGQVISISPPVKV